MPEMNPILVKELRSRMRGPRAFVLLSIYLLVLSAAVLLLYIAMANNSASDIGAGREIGKGLFLMIGAVALIQVCIITPSLTSGSIAGERERQSYDLLIASPLSSWQIVWGKLASALAFALLLVISVLPLMAMAFLFGGSSLVLAAEQAMPAENAADMASEQPVTDTWITTKVKADLATTEGIKSTDISVETVNGVVTLIGVLDSKTAVDKAIAVAKGIKGVVDVDASGLKAK